MKKSWRNSNLAGCKLIVSGHEAQSDGLDCQKKITNPGLSIIIPHFNNGDTIAHCINSIRMSKFTDYEIIVVDDASTDSSFNILDGMDVRLIKLHKNCGPAKARNIGAKLAGTDILLFIDADVIIREDTLEEIARIFDEMDDISAITGLPSLYSPYDNLCSQHFNMRIHFKYMNLHDYVQVTYTTITAIRRGAFFEVGGFNEDLKTAGVEDAELGFDLVSKGHQIYAPKYLQVIHNKRLSFLVLAMNEVRRARDRIKLVIRRRLLKKDSIESGIREKRFVSSPLGHILSSISSPFLYGSLLMSLYSRSFFLLTGVILALFLIWNRSYLLFVVKKRGISYAGRIFILILAETGFAHLGFWIGVCQYLMGKRY